jgi:tetratricopeptide (TPR) repeat protein
MLHLLLALGGCDVVEGLLGDPSAAVAEAEALLSSGDYGGAAARYEEAVKRAPTHPDAASGAAYMKLLSGDTTSADRVLAAAEADAGPRLGEIKLRRALVAMRAGDLDKVKEHAGAANLPAGKLLVAEVHLADGDRDAAKSMLEQMQNDQDAVGEAARAYLDLMADKNPLVAGLSEAQALWALNQRAIAVRSVEELAKAYADAREDGADQLLLWAGRAASVGETQIAGNLLEAITVPPPGMGWRVMATRALVLCADGKGAACADALDAIAAGAPADGYADARATAAMIVAEKDPEAARRLVDGLPGDAAARVLAALGDPGAAAAAAADPILKAQFAAGG